MTRSNNYPDNIAAYSENLDSEKELGGCPRKLNTDLGTENGTMAGIHCFFMTKTRASMLLRQEIKELRHGGLF